MISLRASLLLGFVSILLLTATGIVVNNIVSARRVSKILTSTLVEQSTELTNAKLEAFFGAPADFCTSLAAWSERGLFLGGDPGHFIAFMTTIMDELPQVSAISIGNDQGHGQMLKRDGTNWLSRQVRVDEWALTAKWTRWNPALEVVGKWEDSLGYDPRFRPWYIGATNLAATVGGTANLEALLSWSEPYRFFTSQEVGVTLSLRLPRSDKREVVIAFDIKLKDLDEFVATHPPTPNGFAIVLNDQGQVLGWPGAQDKSREAMLAGAKRTRLIESRVPILAEAAQAWEEDGRPDEYQRTIGTGPDQHWLSFRPVRVAGTTFWSVLVMPERDFLGEVWAERKRLAMVALGGMGVTVLVAFLLAALYTRPLAALAGRSERIERLELPEPNGVKSRIAEVARLSTAQDRVVAALESFSRYVPRGVIRELMSRGEAAKIGAHPTELTILFSDIRGFTALSEQRPPDEIARHLSDYFDAVHLVIDKHHGTTDKFIGDAVMAFWGAPKPDREHALHAVEAVVECRSLMDRLNEEWRAAGRPELVTTFGLATGPVAVGNVGARNRMNYTVMGNTVNVASRCVGLGRDLGCEVLTSESVVDAAGDKIEWRRLGLVRVRGIRRPMMVCEPLGRRGEVPARTLAFRDQYEAALDLFLNRDFHAAQQSLQRLLQSHPRRESVQYLLNRCIELQGVVDEIDPEMLILGGAPAHVGAAGKK